MRKATDNRFSRRDLARISAAGVLGGSMSGWFGELARQAAGQAEPARKPRSCILLWMDGGPSQLDTFDPKPEASADVRGTLGAIDTSVAGIQICERLPRFARLMEHAAILRGMSTDEADHARARIYMHTGYKPGVGGVDYPPLGSIVSAELGNPDFALPNFVATGVPLTKHDFITTPGYLGPRHQGLAHANPDQTLENLKPPAGAEDFDARADVLNQLEQNFARRYKSAAADSHRTTFARAVQLMKSEHNRAFDLSEEPASARDAYGDSRFGRCCLLARRLVETGVRFVEVYQQNWDTHEKWVADAVQEMLPSVDQGMSALVADLHQRGRLEDTLVIWMGEFGRTPRINRNGGRDHYSAAWSSVLAGGGIRGGQVVGRTDANAGRVIDRPISAKDFMATVCQALGIDYQRSINTPVGRPVRIVDTGARPIEELF